MYYMTLVFFHYVIIFLIQQTHLQSLAKPTTPKRTENRSYIVESLSPSTSPRKPKNVSKPASEVQQKEGGEKRNKIVIQWNRSPKKECLSVPRTCGDAKRKLTKDANETNCKLDRNLKSDSFHSPPKLSKLVNKEDTIDKTAVEERLQSSEKQSCDSNVTRQKISHSGQYIGKSLRVRPWEPGEERLQSSEKKTCDSTVISQKISNCSYTQKYLRERQWEPYKTRDTQIPNLARERNEIMPRRFKVPDVPDVCGVASLRLERLKKQLREERLKKCQRPQPGKKSNIESSRGVATEYSYDIHQRKPIENVSYNASSNYSTPLRSHGKDVETDGKGNEVVPSSWEWSPQGFVRDYNHKSISGSDQRSAATVNNRSLHEKSLAKCKLKIKSAREEKQFKDRIGVTNESEISTLPLKSSRLVTSVPFSRSLYPERSGINVERLTLPRKTVQLSSLPKKGLGVIESEQKKKVKDETCIKIDPEIYHRSSCNNTDSDGTEQSKNSCVGNKGIQSKLKQKSHDSKGGITKISRRVQKQVRTAAPKLIHLSSASIRNELESSLQHKSMDLNCKPVDAAKFIEEEEEMDWEPIEPEKVVMQVEALRKEGSFQNTINPELVNLCNMDIEMSSQWFVVLDTNVLLSHLASLRGLRDTKDAELGMPTLFVPWVVLQELDHLKSAYQREALQSYARRAINFIYDNLLKKHPRVGGQPKAEADEYDALEPDDSILQCSLNLQKHSSKVLLLTNDRNLFNKAIVNGVECCSAPKLLQELENRCKLSASASSPSITVLDDNKHPFHSTIQTVKQCVGIVLEELLRTEMVLVYDRQWSEIVARKPPWTLNDILFCILKHWIAVFRLVLPSAARELIEKLRTFVNNEAYETSLESVESLVKTCIALMHLVSSLSYKQYVDTALKTLNALQKSSLKGHTKLRASSTFVATSKADNVLLASTTTQQYDSDAASVLSKDEQHSRSSGTGIDSRGNDNSSISKADTDDCLSLFASSFSEDVGNNQLPDGYVERGQELTHQYLNKIWEKIAIYCGMLCDVMGIEPCVPYHPPEPFPAVETLHQNMLFFVKCVSTLLRCMEGILLSQPNELRENNPMILNFCNSIKESLPTWNELGEVLLPQHVLAYCTQTDSRQQLEHGKKQFEEFEAVLNRAVTFFMGQNQSLTSLPSF